MSNCRMTFTKPAIKHTQLAMRAMIGFATVLGMTSHASTLQTTLEQGEQGTKLVVVQKDAQGRQLDMPPAQLGISPPSVDLAVRGRADTSITFYNYSEESKFVELSLVDTDEQFEPIDGGTEALKLWTVVAPQSFEIVGGGHQTIRLSFRMPADLSKATYQGFLVIKQKIDQPIVEQTEALTVVKIGSQYHLPIRLTNVNSQK